MTGLTVETKLSGLMLTDPKKWERQAGLVVEKAVETGALMMQDAVIGDGGTMRKPDNLFFRGTMANSFRPLVPSGKWPKDVAVTFGSPHVHALVMEEGGKWTKHPPIIATKSFSVPDKTHKVRSFTRKDGASVKAHKRTVKAHKASVKVSVLDAWIKNPRKMAIKGEDLEAYRKRAGIAYRIGENLKKRGMKGHHYLARAVTKQGPKVNKLIAKLISEGWAKLR